MELKLEKMFDYQKFDGNEDLQRIIDSVHQRYSVRELSVDEMEWVAAAGDHAASHQKRSTKDQL